MPFRPDPRRFAAPAVIYAAFVVYGSLVPLAFQARGLGEVWNTFVNIPYLPLGLASRADWVANLLLYIPLAFFAVAWVERGLRSAPASILAFVACASLALGVEFAQLFFPPRTVSLNDLVAELLGAACGIALWHLFGRRLVVVWDAALSGDLRAATGLYTAAYVAYALFPYDFVLSAAELSQKVAAAGPRWLLAAEVLAAAPVGIFLAITGARTRLAGPWLMLACAAVLGLAIEGVQALLVSASAQGSAALARGLGVVLGYGAWRHWRKEWLVDYREHIKFAALVLLPCYAALLLALSGAFGTGLDGREMALAKLRDLRWLPFHYHYFTTEVDAVRSVLIHAAAYAPVGVLAWLYASDGRARRALWRAGTAAFVVALAVETLKLFLVGKRPDPTHALIAVGAAALTCLLAQRLARPGGRTPEAAPNPSARGRRPLALATALTFGALGLTGWLFAMQPTERPAVPMRAAGLPPTELLPPVNLAGFRRDHPRLPHPAAGEIAILRRHNPAYLRDVAHFAAGGKGDLHHAVLQEFVEPGTIDLDLLHRRLLALEFVYRGHDVKPLAVAYDWLYARWSDRQRALLRDKVLDGCDYLVRFIRQERLSPYNVYLYNAPLQTLMACAIAAYGDDPRGEAVMRFTHEVWKNRVLPVWRHVMGHSGGWHEGGEYVGIGIGQAIYQLPAMWRHATGEDYIAAEPGIRGFLDFLVYRTQPDGTHFRWGDGSHFNREVPDALPLALELRHAAAYALQRAPDAPTPSSWPWGPLTDVTLKDPAAVNRLPLTKHFDGIGMVVMRSDWTADATYVTFKAGDNFWSHVHLDQGAFTIYKRGSLAIDSGVYGPGYGSDHHMNYSYQTIAHNTITVTDPKDTVPIPRKERPRPIANDGGQRRVGSGWGEEAAPVDRAEWQAKRDIYHTGRIERVLEQDGITAIVADITAAYTNTQSGKGTFSHRTRRVERAWRTFAYDRISDTVVVFDEVVSADPSFRKRWLLHSTTAPRMMPDGFVVQLANSSVEARVLLPARPLLNAIGGKGLQFYVDGVNYDERGGLEPVLEQYRRRKVEPGAWRIELSPTEPATRDVFLVVLSLRDAAATQAMRARLVQTQDGIGCEISTPQRNTRWLFGAKSLRVEVDP